MKKIWGRIWEDLKDIRWVILSLCLYWLAARIWFHNFCPMVILTGLPCPGCGMTRAALKLATFQFAAAWNYNPAIYLWALWGIHAVRYRYIKGERIAHKNLTLGVVLVVTLVVYCYRMAVVFPAEVPMAYRYDNFLANLFPGYKILLKKIWPL